MTRERFEFPNQSGQLLAGVLDRPAGTPTAFALLAHCFTCGKDNLAAGRIAETLAGRGLAVVRFDFTGLGSSEGDFANTGFSSNVADLVSAADHMAQSLAPPALLIGHSLGGAAVLAAAGRIPMARAVATIAAPSDPAHVVNLFRDKVADIEALGEMEVQLAGRPFRIRREFLADVAEQRLTWHVAALNRPLLIFHSPTDDTVSVDNAARLFTAARHPKSFISLAGADHLLRRRNDAVYVANMISTWAERYST